MGHLPRSLPPIRSRASPGSCALLGSVVELVPVGGVVSAAVGADAHLTLDGLDVGDVPLGGQPRRNIGVIQLVGVPGILALRLLDIPAVARRGALGRFDCTLLRSGLFRRGVRHVLVVPRTSSPDRCVLRASVVVLRTGTLIDSPTGALKAGSDRGGHRITLTGKQGIGGQAGDDDRAEQQPDAAQLEQVEHANARKEQQEASE